MDQFTGRTAVITGAGSGIGRGLSLRAAEEGMRCVLADVEEAALAETVAAVAATGAEVVGVPVDVRDAESVEALADLAYDRFGGVHLLCNNAGVFQAGVSWQRTVADWSWVMGVNFWGVLHGVRAFVPRMLAQEQAGETQLHIVNTSSLAGMTTSAYSGPYYVSKFACASLTEVLAHDLRAQGSAIGVSCLVPGAVDTRIADSTRNRPDEPPGEAQAPDHWFVADALRDMTTTVGIPPEEAAGIVFDGVRSGQFWICTTERFAEVLAPRFEAILRHELPPSVQF